MRKRIDPVSVEHDEGLISFAKAIYERRSHGQPGFQTWDKLAPYAKSHWISVAETARFVASNNPEFCMQMKPLGWRVVSAEGRTIMWDYDEMEVRAVRDCKYPDLSVAAMWSHDEHLSEARIDGAMTLIDERLAIVWVQPGSRESFREELRVALYPIIHEERT